MIVMICGLIGAGKTTFAKANFDHVTDYDNVGSKARQIVETLGRYRQGQTVAHITCWPTLLEKKAILEGEAAGDVRMVWINTGPEQSLKNIFARARPRDMEHLTEVMKVNRALNEKRQRSVYPWEDVDVFA